jgi:hypothetical protein
VVAGAAGVGHGVAAGGEIATNQVELWAWTDPIASLAAGQGALDAQHELGALHELGKTHAAIAIALTRLGRYAEAEESFETACEFLDRARYRSGRARAELFRGFLHARHGRLDEAASSFVWAAGEFVGAQVYPTLIIMAEHALIQLGLPDPHVTAAAEAARAQIEPLNSIIELEQRTVAMVAGMLGEGRVSREKGCLDPELCTAVEALRRTAEVNQESP